jgi:hypothetical protein
LDEGDRFRTQVRQGLATEGIYQPTGGLFGNLAPAVHEYLESLGVDIRLNCTLELSTSQTIKAGFAAVGVQSPLEKAVFAAPAQSVLAGIRPDMMARLAPGQATRVLGVVDLDEPSISPSMTQTLVLDENAPDLARISFAPGLTEAERSASRVPLVLEFSVRGRWNNDERPLRDQATNALARLGSNVRWRGAVTLGSSYSPPDDWVREATAGVEDWQRSEFPGLRIEPHFGPINMAKAWLQAAAVCETADLRP